MNLNKIALVTGLAVSGITVSSVFAPSHAATITTFVDGRSGPWLSAPNPSFDIGVPSLNPTVIDNTTGLPITVGDALTITYINGLSYGGGGHYGDANGNTVFGNLQGIPSSPAFYIPLSQSPVFFLALVGVFTDSNGIIVGNPFKIGNGPFNATIPTGATELSMGVIDGTNGYFDNGGGLTISIAESTVVSAIVPEPSTILGLGTIVGLGLISGLKRKLSKK